VGLCDDKESSQIYEGELQPEALVSQRNNEARYRILQPSLRDCSKLK
jgi:hypothetical protein